VFCCYVYEFAFFSTVDMYFDITIMLCKSVNNDFIYQLYECFKLFFFVQRKALARLKVEKMENDPKLKKKGTKFYNNKTVYAMSTFAYYMCHKCKVCMFVCIMIALAWFC